MAPTQGESQFQFTVASFPARSFEVVSFRGREEMSKPFSFEVSLLAEPDTGLEESLLGQAATLSFNIPARAPRLVRGTVVSVEPLVPAAMQGRHAYRLRLVPRLCLLRHRITSRIFQDRTVPEIVAAVLREANVEAEFKLSRSYPRRGYCVQHQESDLAFLRRLLGEEGIFYFIEHPDGAGATEKLIFGDTAEVYPAIAAAAAHELDMTGAFMLSKLGQAPSPRLRVRDRAGMSATEDDVLRFSLRRSVRPGAVLLRDYDFRRPLLELEAQAAAEKGDRALRIYNHRGEFDEAEADPTAVRTQLEQHRRAAALGEGETGCRRLLPGHRFRLAAESDPKLAGEYVVTRIDHEGRAPAFAGAGGDRPSYTSRFQCVPAIVAFRPKRPRRAPRQVLESATVVGPPNEEIHVDAHGRIKVQFHWDLEGKRNEHSSCWIRVVQAWAGTSWGLQFIPRIGMEVMVTFLGGDQDCPVIIGCAYNATHPPPFILPNDKTKSGIRTQSTPGSGNFNELSFDDRAGAERILVQAARDLEEVVANEHRLTVRGEQSVSVTGSRMDTVMGSQTRVTSGDLREVSLGSRIDQVGGARQEEIGGGRAVTVHGLDASTVKGDAVKTVEGETNVRIHGSFTSEIGAEDDRRAVDTFVWGDGALGASDGLRLRGDGSLVLASGESRIELTPKGIVLHAPQITLGGMSVTLRGDGPALRLEKEAEITADAVRIYAAGSSLELEEDARLDGRTVKLNCGPLDPDEMVDEQGRSTLQHLRLRLTDVAMKAYAEKDYVLRAQGVRIDGKTDADGLLEADLPAEAKTAEITLWIEPRPTGKTKRYVVELGELAAPETVAGAESRLRNLGYFWGASHSEMTGDLARALRDFQQDHGIQPTGRLDAATRAKLVEIHGH